MERTPFDSRNLFGYLIAFIYQCIVFWNGIYFISCMICFGIGVYLFGLTLAEFLENILYQINKDAKDKRLRLEVMHSLCDFVELQATIKKLSWYSLWIIQLV